MADRVPVTITIGGALTAADRETFVAIIIDEGLSTDWEGAPFDSTQLVDGAPLTLHALETSWGQLDTLECFCVEHGLAFARAAGGCPGSFDPERTVFTGSGTPLSYATSEDDDVLIGRQTAESLGYYEAIIANFAAADFVVPPLRLTV